MLTRARAVVIAFAALPLAACGSIHPGDAAVIDGHSISMSTFDRSARLLCEVSLLEAQSQGQESLPNDQVRRQAIVNIVTVKVARDLAKQKGVTPSKTTYELPASQVASIVKAFPDDKDAKEVESIYEDYNETVEIAISLGEQKTGLARSDENQELLVKEGQTAIQKAFKEHDVKFSPRFGLNGSLEDLGASGSVSVPEVGLDSQTDRVVPPSQRCA